MDKKNEKRVYSDGGENERYLLKIAQEYPEDLSADFVEDKNRYLLDHTFSPVRRNLLNWYPFRENAELLEIGAGMGALTGLFCDRCKTVTAVEMSDRRADVIRARYLNRNNLFVISADITNWDTDKRFDYVVFVGVLEYAASFSDSQDPFNEFLKKAAGFLNENGIMLFAIENQYGLKYWCGAAEDHLHVAFAGIQGYSHRRSPETFSKKALQDMLINVGLNRWRFYYPLPDYKFPAVIYSDDYLPDHKDLMELRFLYHRSSILTADEKKIYREIIDNGVFDFFANSFLIEAGVSWLPEKHVVYVSARDKIKKQFRVTTIIDDDGVVTKFPFSPHAASHLGNIFENSEYLKCRGVDVTALERHGYTLTSNRYYSRRADSVFEQYLIDNDTGSLFRLIDTLAESIEMSSAPSGISVCDDIILERGFIDMTFSNCFFNDFKLTFFDQEFVFPDVPLKYILYRSVSQSYFNSDVRTRIQFEAILRHIGVSPEMRILYDRLSDNMSSEIFGIIDNSYSEINYLNPFSNELTLNNERNRMDKTFRLFSKYKNELEIYQENERKLAKKIEMLEAEIKHKNAELEYLKQTSRDGMEGDFPPMQKSVAIFLDDVINNFSKTINESGILFDRKIHSFDDLLLKKTIYNLTTGTLTEAGEKIMQSTSVIEGAEELMSCLKENGWEIIICTDRDLRFASRITKAWLDDNHLPYSCLFQVDDIFEFCRILNINCLVNEKPVISVDGIRINYQTVIQNKYKNNSIQFRGIEEAEKWITEKSF